MFLQEITQLLAGVKIAFVYNGRNEKAQRILEKNMGSVEHHSVPTSLRRAKTFLQDKY